MLTIHDLHAEIDGKKILNGLSLKIGSGEIHAIMGPNGAGKSTLCRILLGDPAYQVTHGSCLFEGEDLLAQEADKRSHKGLFVGYQYPIEVPGVTNLQFLHAAISAHLKALGKDAIDLASFRAKAESCAARIGIAPSYLERDLNAHFSGGEKKRNEILQMALLAPKLAVLDETDSGLDIDALKQIAKSLLEELPSGSSVLVITHYQRLLDYLKPDFVHVMHQGQIVKSSDASLAMRLEQEGYDWVTKEGALLV